MSGRPWLVRQAGPPARVMLWEILRARGRDVTAASARRSCLVLAAHPDDETLGCAATIMRKRDAGTRVVLVIATDGSRSSVSKSLSPREIADIRAAETEEAGRRLGLGPEEIIHLGFADSMLGAESEELVGRLVGVMRAHHPDEVLVTALTDPHPDHAALGLAARRAVAEPGLAGMRILEYPIWQWREPASWFASSPAPGLRGTVRELARLRPELVATSGYLDRKRAVLDAYRSQVGNLTGEEEWWSLDSRFLANFFRSHEIYLPVRVPED